MTFGALAAIFAISFVFLGVGTGGGGFSFSDLFGGGSSGSAASAFDDDISAAQQQLAVNPNDPATLARLVQLHYQAGNADRNSDGTLTSDGEQQLREAADAWTKYVKASNGNLDADGPAVRDQHLRPARPDRLPAGSHRHHHHRGAGRRERGRG